MHELSLAQQLLSKINELAEENGLFHLRRVGVLVEGATGESLEPLTAAFELAAEATPAAGAKLVLEYAEAGNHSDGTKSLLEAGDDHHGHLSLAVCWLEGD